MLNNVGFTNVSKNPTSFTILHRSFKAVSLASITSVRVCCMRKLLDFYNVLTLTLFTVFDIFHFLLVQVKHNVNWKDSKQFLIN